MGCASSGPENVQAHNNKEIGKFIEKDREMEKQVKKLLLLGSGSSGKSTLFKQIKRIHGVEVEPAEKNESKHVIRMNLVQGMLVLLQQAHKLYEADPIENKKCQVEYYYYFAFFSFINHQDERLFILLLFFVVNLFL